MISRGTTRYEMRCDDTYRGVNGQEIRIPAPRSSSLAVSVLLTGGSWVDLDVKWSSPGGTAQAFSPAVQLTTGSRSAKIAADELIGAEELVIRGASTSAGHSCVVFVTAEVETSPSEAAPTPGGMGAF